MSIGKSIEAKNAEGKMTYGDLKEFVAELGIAGAADSTPIKASVTFGGNLKSLKAVAER